VGREGSGGARAAAWRGGVLGSQDYLTYRSVTTRE